jgi:predicted nucleic acid-binding protein
MKRTDDAEATRPGFITIDTLSVLDRAAETNLISFAEAIDRLRKTPFREPKQIVEASLKNTNKYNQLALSLRANSQPV